MSCMNVASYCDNLGLKLLIFMQSLVVMCCCTVPGKEISRFFFVTKSNITFIEFSHWVTFSFVETKVQILGLKPKLSRKIK